MLKSTRSSSSSLRAAYCFSNSLETALPTASANGDTDIADVGRPSVLVGHLEEDQIGKLLQVVAITHPVIAQGGAEAPDFGDDGGGVHADESFPMVCRARASPAAVRR